MGWAHFQLGEYEDALIDFDNAIALDEMFHPADLGQGWTYMMLDQFSYSIEALDRVADLNLIPDASVARALIYNAEGDYQQSLTQLANISDANWNFTYLPNLDINNLNLLRAHNQIALNNFADALTAFQLVDPAFTADVSTDAGRLALLNAIEALNPGISAITN